MAGQFAPVELAKLGEALGRMIKLAAQFGGGRHLAQPGVQLQGCLAAPAWPEPVDQYPPAIGCGRRLVYPLALNHRSAPLWLPYG
ncbi:hypothetical protein FQZ97_1219050 [compost metagenome]